MAAKGRPKRRAAKTHYFKYQLSGNPSRAEENDLKKALEESLKEQSPNDRQTKKRTTTRSSTPYRNTNITSNNNNNISTKPNNNIIIKNNVSSNQNHRNNFSDISYTSTSSSDVTNNSNKSSSSNDVEIISVTSANSKKTRSSSSLNVLKVSPPNNNKRAKLSLTPNFNPSTVTNGRNHRHNNKCDVSPAISIDSPPVTFSRNVACEKPIKTYSRNSSGATNSNGNQRKTPSSSPPNNHSGLKPSEASSISSTKVVSKGVQTQSTDKHSSNSKLDKCLKNGNGSLHDCSLEFTSDLSDRNRNKQEAQLKTMKKRAQGSWSLLGVPEEKILYLRDDEPPRRLICYPAIKHVEGDVIQVRDSVLLRSGAKKTDLPYIAKICSFWKDAETGNIMMSLLWYYRPEHTEDGRKPHHLQDEIFASRHRDMDSVECIEDKCYVLTFNEYCRYRKRCKMEQVNTTWSLADVTIPVSNEPYPRRNRIPDSNVNPELVFCCRQIYDSRMRRLVKNPLISRKYGHI